MPAQQSKGLLCRDFVPIEGSKLYKDINIINSRTIREVNSCNLLLLLYVFALPFLQFCLPSF